MATSANKTKPAIVRVETFIAAVPAGRREDAKVLLKLFKDVTGLPAKMWGPSIIGFGSYHYKYDSGREGDMCRAGFSPRKDKLTLYMMGGYCNPQTQKKLAALRAKLGKHKTGASCLYINKLADVDLKVLREMVEVDFAYMNKAYPP
ncbi:MAG: DUF1801 domain-containing protein [Aestuariivirga sp.]